MEHTFGDDTRIIPTLGTRKKRERTDHVSKIDVAADASDEKHMIQNNVLYGGKFNVHDRNNPRTIIASWVPEHAKVLEIGPGDGVVSRWLKQSKQCQTVGVELNAAADYAARDAFDHMVIGNIEDATALSQIRAHSPFDAIIFADVLEHLVDPWTVLRNVRPILSAQGHVLLSVPNIAHWTARLNLLIGRFDYTDGFLMDRSHLRWFTRRSAREMARSTGYRIAQEATVYKPRWARFLGTLNGFQIVLDLVECE